MTIAFGSAGAAATGTNSLSVAHPASISAGNLLVLFISNKYPSNGPVQPSSDWIFGGQFSGGAGSAGSDSGTVYITVYFKYADGTETGNLSVSIPSGNSAIGWIIRYTCDPTKVFDVSTVQAGGSDNTAGTAISVTANADPHMTAGNMVLVGAAMNTDARTYNGQALTASGISVWGSVVERLDSVSATGDQCALVVSEHPITTGTSSAPPVFTMTASGTAGNQNAGAAAFLVLREAFAVVQNDTAASTDSVLSSRDQGRLLTDANLVTDSVSANKITGKDFGVTLSDVLFVSDSISASNKCTVSAISPRVVRLAFESEMTDNAALVDPTNYVLTNLSGTSLTVSSVVKSPLTGPRSVTLMLAADLQTNGYYSVTVNPAIVTITGLGLEPSTFLFSWVDGSKNFNVPLSSFSGEVQGGLLGNHGGLVFFSPALNTSAPGSVLQVDNVKVCTTAYDTYTFPGLVDPTALYTWTPGGTTVPISPLNTSSTVLWAPWYRLNEARIGLSYKLPSTDLFTFSGAASQLFFTLSQTLGDTTFGTTNKLTEGVNVWKVDGVLISSVLVVSDSITVAFGVGLQQRTANDTLAVTDTAVANFVKNLTLPDTLVITDQLLLDKVHDLKDTIIGPDNLTVTDAATIATYFIRLVSVSDALTTPDSNLTNMERTKTLATDTVSVTDTVSISKSRDIVTSTDSVGITDSSVQDFTSFMQSMPFTSWFKGSYPSSLPWTGTASAGTSATRSISSGIGSVIQGTPQNGFYPADFTQNTTDELDIPSDVFTGFTNGYAFWAVAKVDSVGQFVKVGPLRIEFISNLMRFNWIDQGGVLTQGGVSSSILGDGNYHFLWGNVTIINSTQTKVEIPVASFTYNTPYNNVSTSGSYFIGGVSSDTFGGSILEFGTINRALTATELSYMQAECKRLYNF